MRESSGSGASAPAVGDDVPMTFVAINVLSVPESAGATLEERFARRAGSVERAPGFEHFELLRPLEGTDSYLVYTRWDSRESFDAWTQSQSAPRTRRATAHLQGAGARRARREPVPG